jgi:hypothetical protein
MEKVRKCENCKHYSESDADEFYQGVYQAVFRNECNLDPDEPTEPMPKYWVQSCEHWEDRNVG